MQALFFGKKTESVAQKGAYKGFLFLCIKVGREANKMTQQEAEIYHMLDMVDVFLIAPSCASRGDAKEQIRFSLEQGKKKEPGEVLRDMYLSQQEGVVIVQVRDGVVEINGEGIRLEGYSFSWEEVALRIRELSALGRYMTPAEDRSYLEYCGAMQEIAFDLCQSPIQKERCMAAMEYGEQAWKQLVNDPNEFVRAAVAVSATEEYQLQMLQDPSSGVRSLLVSKGTPYVREALAAVETDKSVLRELAEVFPPEGLGKLLDRPCVMRLPEVLRVISRRGNPEIQEHILSHPDPTVAACAVSQANEQQCMQLLSRKDLPSGTAWEIQMRLKELGDAMQSNAQLEWTPTKE